MTAELAGMPVLETERLTLRGPKPSDWPHWRDFAMSDRAAHIGGPYDLKGAWRSCAHIFGLWAVRGYGSFVFTMKGEDTPLGMAGPWHPMEWPEPELAWTVWSKAHEGKGLAREAAIAGRSYAYAALGWKTVVSYIAPENLRSIALAKRLGAWLDDDCDRPSPESLVYRHPSPECSA